MASLAGMLKQRDFRVTDGRSKHTLSDEEQQAIRAALQ